MDAHQSIWSMLTAAVRSLIRRSTKAIGRTHSDPPARGPLTDWTDAELYRVWCATAAELLKALHAEHTEDADPTATAAEARQHLLAEIERRHPRATAAWLASDAILSGEPPRFLIRDT